MLASLPLMHLTHGGTGARSLLSGASSSQEAFPFTPISIAGRQSDNQQQGSDQNSTALSQIQLSFSGESGLDLDSIQEGSDNAATDTIEGLLAYLQQMLSPEQYQALLADAGLSAEEAGAITTADVQAGSQLLATQELNQQAAAALDTILSSLANLAQQTDISQHPVANQQAIEGLVERVSVALNNFEQPGSAITGSAPVSWQPQTGQQSGQQPGQQAGQAVVQYLLQNPSIMDTLTNSGHLTPELHRMLQAEIESAQPGLSSKEVQRLIHQFMQQAQHQTQVNAQSVLSAPQAVNNDLLSYLSSKYNSGVVGDAVASSNGGVAASVISGLFGLDQDGLGDDGLFNLTLAGQNVQDASNVLSFRPHTTQSQGNPLEQIYIGIRQALQNGYNQIVVKLSPAELGKVEIKMDWHHGGATKISMIVERQETLDMLQRDARLLVRMMQDNGIDVEQNQMQFSLSDHQQQQYAGTEGQSQNSANNGFAETLDVADGSNITQLSHWEELATSALYNEQQLTLDVMAGLDIAV